MVKERFRAFKLWSLCCSVVPLLLAMQLLQGLFGSIERSVNMAAALDACGNALFGGDFRMTISERTGLGVMEGKKWANKVAPVIDFFFGKDHCRIEAEQWLAEQKNIQLPLFPTS